MSNTLFEQIGGSAAVDAAVNRFYEIVLEDDRINHFFAAVDMKRMIVHQKLFLSYAFGGVENYSGKSMRDAHAKLVENMGLSDEHFDAVVEDLGKALNNLGVPQGIIMEVNGIAESTRADILNKA